jgi:hypothetical protein
MGCPPHPYPLPPGERGISEEIAIMVRGKGGNLYGKEKGPDKEKSAAEEKGSDEKKDS